MIVVRRDLVDDYLRRKARRTGIGAVRRRFDAWWAEASAAQWRTPIDVKARYATASVLKSGRVVFNIKGNDYRLVVRINYRAGVVEILFFGSHAEYDRIDAGTV